jgi:hypothetical protein
MKKIAIFVEGQTELIFVQELVRQIIGVANVVIRTQSLSGKDGARKISFVYSPVENEAADFFFLICNSRQDMQVKSDILRQLPSLQSQSYSMIIGIRDAYHDGHPEYDIEKLKKSIAIGIPITGMPINIILAIQEVEAWFIAEENHYSKISPLLTIEKINQITNLDVTTDSTEILDHPFDVLTKIYDSVGTSYSKKKYEVENIVYNLDYENLYLNVRNRNTSFNELVSCLDTIVSIGKAE